MTTALANNLSGVTTSALLALAIGIGGTAWAQTQRPDLPFEVVVPDFTQNEDVAYEVAAARSAWVEAFEAQDVEQIMSFYVEDIYSYDLMAAPGSDGMAMAFDGTDSWRANWVGFFELFEDDLKVTINDLTVYQSGDVATVRGLTRLAGTTSNGQFIDIWARETNVLRKIDGRWLVVHDHVSVPIDFATGRALMDLKPPAR